MTPTPYATAAKIRVSTWSGVWVETLDVETRTDENYRARLAGPAA